MNIAKANRTQNGEAISVAARIRVKEVKVSYRDETIWQD